MGSRNPSLPPSRNEGETFSQNPLPLWGRASAEQGRRPTAGTNGPMVPDSDGIAPTPSAKETMIYTLFVVSPTNRGVPSEPREMGKFTSGAAAIAAARAVVESYLESAARLGTPPEALFSGYENYGPNASIVTDDPEFAFSARDCAREHCAAICAAAGLPREGTEAGGRMDEAAWLTGDDPEAMLVWLTEPHPSDLHPRGPASDRKLRLFAVACCRSVWPQLTNARSRNAVEVAERYADRLAAESERKAADAEADRALGECATDKLNWGAWAASWAVDADIRRGARKLAARPNVLPGQPAAATQAALLRELFGNPFRPVPRSGDEPKVWLAANGGHVVAVARKMYEEGDYSADAYAILRDALVDAGCDDDGILGHCQGAEGRLPAAHPRGCWVVDWALGKE